jgi:amino acid transporter
VTADTGSVGASLLVWLGSGLLAWTGASSFAELGAAIPLNGGAHAYLNYAIGPTAAYLFTWTAIVALKVPRRFLVLFEAASNRQSR